MATDSTQLPTPQERLRTELAVNCTPDVIANFVREANGMTSHGPDRDIYFQNAYIEMNREAFDASHGHSKESQRPGVIESLDKAEQYRKLINIFTDQFFDNNKFPISSSGDIAKRRREAAEHMAEFYIGMRNLRPFSYGNELTLNSFMKSFGQLDSFQDTHSTTLDFRRLQDGQEDILRQSDDVAAVAKVFEVALTPDLTPTLDNKRDEYGKLGKHVSQMAGINFLNHEEDGVEYLVTVDGGLILKSNVEEAFNKHRHEKGMVSEFRVKPEKYLDISIPQPDGSTKPLRDMQMIDGYEITEEGSPLICLDVDIRTGLRKTHQNEIENYLKSKHHPTLDRPFQLFDMENPEYAAKLIHDAPTASMRKMLELAAQHVRNITHQLDASKASIFEGKTPVDASQQAQFVMSMGGPGAGKGMVSKVAAAYTDDNFVEASLDKSRISSALYHVLGKVGHHADDYALVEPFAVAMRKWVSDHAKEKHYNILYDGTGVDFAPRYEKIAGDFKKSNYRTTVCMVDSMFTVPDERRKECPQPVIDRIQSRLKEGEQRILPWNITVAKHRGVMKSFLQAFNSLSVDKVMAFCADGPPPRDKNDPSQDKSYLMAESFDLDPDAYTPIENANQEMRVMDARAMLKSKDSVLHKLAEYQAQKGDAGRGGKSLIGDEIDKMIGKIPAFAGDNITLLCDDSSSKNRGLLITNVTRMVDVAQKRLLNPKASGPSTLLKISPEFSFLVPQEGMHRRNVEGEVPLQVPPAEYSEAVARKFQEAPFVAK